MMSRMTHLLCAAASAVALSSCQAQPLERGGQSAVSAPVVAAPAASPAAAPAPSASPAPAPPQAEAPEGGKFDPTAETLSRIAGQKVNPGDWPQWAGSHLRNNTPAGKNIPISWSVEDGTNIKW